VVRHWQKGQKKIQKDEDVVAGVVVAVVDDNATWADGVDLGEEVDGRYNSCS
jgi:hypothetical protein